MTFSLPGFSTLKREGIVLTAGFTAAVNADMQVGALEETITVTGAAPLVDTQNVRQQESVSDELVNTLPSGSKGFAGIARLIPGMSNSSDSSGASGLYSSNTAHGATVHGKGGSKMSYDGMQTSNQSITGHTSYIMNPATLHPGSGSTGPPAGMVEVAVGPRDVAGVAAQQSERLCRHPVVSGAGAREQ